jgi:predicted DNA-binding transcriptional regulator AlpA
MVEMFGIKIDDPLLRPRKVAEMLGIAEQTLAVWRCRKNHGEPAPDLAYVRIGRRAIRYRLSEVKRFIDLNPHANGEQPPADSKQGGQQSC